MKSKPYWILSSVLIAIILLTGACSAGFLVGRVFAADSPQTLVDLPALAGVDESEAKSDPSQGGTPKDLVSLFTAFWQTWDLVHKQYVDQPVDDETLMRGAIRGMLEALGDEHTSYMDPEQYKSVSSELNGEYEGIGAWVDVTGEYLKIISPMPDSPAEKAGIKPDDEIIAVNGEDVTGVPGLVVLQKVKGPRGTTVKLTVRRAGEAEPLQFEIKRAAITVASVESKMLEGDIAYVQLLTFGDDTVASLKTQLRELMAKKPAGLIIDLRNNGGGYLETGIDVASQFIGDGVIMYEEYGNGKRETYNARRGGLATDIPIVILINQGSASASEIVAGAIQDRGRGKLVGETSFGKGSVQIFSPLKNDQGAVRVTIARWLTPNGATINQKGLTPDVTVKLTEEDVKADRDPQLEAALKLLKEKK